MPLLKQGGGHVPIESGLDLQHRKTGFFSLIFTKLVVVVVSFFHWKMIMFLLWLDFVLKAELRTTWGCQESTSIPYAFGEISLGNVSGQENKMMML